MRAHPRALTEKQTGKRVTPVFITVDPARDGVQQVRQYVKGASTGPSLFCATPLARARRASRSPTNSPTRRGAEFHPRMVGLTGSPEACNAAARAFRVYHHKTDESQDYLVDHSIIMYLLGAPHSRPAVRRRSA